MSDILQWAIMITTLITLILIVLTIYYAPKGEDEEEVQSEEKEKQNATAIKFLKPHPTQIGQGGRVVLVLESVSHEIGICLKVSAIEELYDNLGTLLRYENFDFEGGEDEEEEEEEDGFVETEAPKLKTKISFKKDRSEFRSLYS